MLSVNLSSTGVFYFACQVGLSCLLTASPVKKAQACVAITCPLLMLLQVGDHCVEDGQKLTVTVTNATAGALSDLAVLSTV